MQLMTTSDTTSDTVLLAALRGGDAAAFQALYRRHQGPLFRYALMRCASRDIAADVIQEVFMGLLTGSLHFDPLRGALAGFLYGVTRKLILRHEQARFPQLALVGEDLPDDDDAYGDDDAACPRQEPLARLLSDELAEQVRRAITLLPPHYRDPVILYELYELSYLDIAAICQIDIGTVRSRLSRGRAALAKRLASLRPTALNEA